MKRFVLAAGTMAMAAMLTPNAGFAQKPSQPKPQQQQTQTPQQQIDLSHGGPVDVSANNGLEYDQQRMTVTARGDARAVRGNVTVTADQLVAYLRKKQGVTATVPAKPAESSVAAPTDTGSNEIYRLEAVGNVHIVTPTDHIEGADHGIYDIDQSVLLMTGPHMRLTTPQQVMTARDSMEYWSAKRMAVGRGDAVVTTADGKQLAADVLVGYTANTDTAPHAVQKTAAHPGMTPPPAQNDDFSGSAGKLQKVEAFGHVLVRTTTETVQGQRGVYMPDTGIARIAGNVHITRGLNQLTGAEAIVNMKTGISRLIEKPGGRVEGLMVPNDDKSESTPKPPSKPAHAAP